MFDTEKFILEVEKHPSLWNPQDEEYQSKVKRREDFRAVAEVICGKWDSMDSFAQVEYIRDLNKKWRNIRDNFKKTEKLLFSENGLAYKRSKYLYFDQLSFMLTTNSSNYTSKSEDEIKVKDELHLDDEDLVLDSNDGELNDENASDYLFVNCDARKHTENEEDCENTGDSLDSDRLFMLSLVPLFRTMSNQQKVATRIELLKVIQQNLPR